MGLDEAAFAALLPRKTKGTCRAGCGIPLDPVLIDDGGSTGIHPNCLLQTPTSTVSQLRDVLISYESNRPRSRQRKLGPSELGTPCDARLVRKLAGSPNHRPGQVAWAPLQGVAMHAELEKVVAHWNRLLGWNRFQPEARLKIAEGLTGTSDLFDLESGTVIDWKLVGATALRKLKGAQRKGLPPAEQISPEYRTQAHLYGLGQTNEGNSVRWVRLVLLPRSANFDEAGEWTERWDSELAHAAVQRYSLLRSVVAELDFPNHPEQIASVDTSPGDACRWCPYHQPSAPTSWESCAGDTSRVDRFADGLL